MTEMRHFVARALRGIEASAQKSIWDAHAGCAALAEALLVAQDLVGGAARTSIEAHVSSAPCLDQEGPDFAAAVSRSSFAKVVLRELAVGAQEPKEIGHDVIYCAYVLRAVEIFDVEPWESLLDGVVTLVRKVKNSGPGWISVNGNNEARELPDAVEDVPSTRWEAFRQLDRPLPMEVGDMQLGHLLTHGHAIEMLREHGTDLLIADLDLAWRKRIHGLRIANDEQHDRTPLRRQAIDPRSKSYWDLIAGFGDMHGHAVKYAYSFLDLNRGEISQVQLEDFGRIVWPAQPASVIACM